MPLLLPDDYAYPLPKLRKVQQVFDHTSLDDVEGTLLKEWARPEIREKIHKGDRVAVAVGSRGIKNLQLIVKTTVDQLKELGAEPFIVSAMGSHGGGTEEGQREVLTGYGITEEFLGVPVVTTVDVIELGKTPSGKTVYFDRAASEADAIIPINRIKLHTDFVGELQSGLCKMMVIGLGNQIGCSSIHEEDPEFFAEIIEDAATIIMEKNPVVCGVAAIENAYDETFHVEILPRENLIAREKELVKIAKTKMPVLIPPKIDVLLVGEIGKEISGAGFDPNILGRSSCLKEYMLPIPDINQMVLLDVTPASHGNAIGLGLFDVTVKKVFDQMDFESTYANSIACRCIADCKIPLVAKDEDEAERVAIKCVRGVDLKDLRVVKIKNTLELGHIEVSEKVLEDIKDDERIVIE